METTQTDTGPTQRRIDCDLVFRAGTGALLALSYLTPGEFAVHQARYQGRMPGALSNANLRLKIYLRRPDDLAMVRNCLKQTFGPASNALYLQADICRADLLLEVEAVYLNASAPMH